MSKLLALERRERRPPTLPACRGPWLQSLCVLFSLRRRTHTIHATPYHHCTPNTPYDHTTIRPYVHTPPMRRSAAVGRRWSHGNSRPMHAHKPNSVQIQLWIRTESRWYGSDSMLIAFSSCFLRFFILAVASYPYTLRGAPRVNSTGLRVHVTNATSSLHAATMARTNTAPGHQVSQHKQDPNHNNPRITDTCRKRLSSNISHFVLFQMFCN